METAHLLRPNQRDELRAEQMELENKLKNPHIEDKGAVGSQLKRLNIQLEKQSPIEPKGQEKDSLVKREAKLRDEMLKGMPSQEEMRKCPPGAIGKHMRWEKDNKKKLLEWKNIRLRLNADSDDPDVANFEMHRPLRNTLNMDNAQISGKEYFFPSEQYKENYDDIDFTVMEQEAKTKPKKKGTYWTPERREAKRQKMIAMHAKKKGEQQ